MFLRNIADHSWTSHLHWIPYLLPQVLDAAAKERDDMCREELYDGGNRGIMGSTAAAGGDDHGTVSGDPNSDRIPADDPTADYSSVFSVAYVSAILRALVSNYLLKWQFLFLRSDVLLPLGFMAAFAGCTLIVLYLLFLNVGVPPPPPGRASVEGGEEAEGGGGMEPGEYQLEEGKVHLI